MCVLCVCVCIRVRRLCESVSEMCVTYEGVCVCAVCGGKSVYN